MEKNARHSFEQRFRVLKPSSKAIAEALESALNLPAPPKRIESFDISHIQGTDTVASMVVWEDGRMKKSDYRKFIIRGEWGNDDFASMREAVERRYRRVQTKRTAMLPSLILIDGGLGQLHAAAQALEKLEIINQPVAAIAKQEEILFVLGQEDEPIRLEKHSPMLHLIQQIRDETHRFAVGFHRQRRRRAHLRPNWTKFPASARARRRNCCGISEASRSCASPASSRSPKWCQRPWRNGSPRTWGAQRHSSARREAGPAIPSSTASSALHPGGKTRDHSATRRNCHHMAIPVGRSRRTSIPGPFSCTTRMRPMFTGDEQDPTKQDRF